MATYAIGDVQGCGVTLKRLLDRVRFAPPRDRLFFVGDLVNRGAHSLTVLRFVKRLGASAESVLGNHDLHLLGIAAGLPKKRRDHTLAPVLAAADRDELLRWLRHRPLLLREDGFVIVHAGLHPRWTLAEAEALARKAEAGLRSRSWRKGILARVGEVEEVGEEASAAERAAFAATVLTHVRTLRKDGALCLKFSGPPSDAPRGCSPWFARPSRRREKVTVVFGHWARLGLHLAPGLAGLDTGCVWGGFLTALRLEDKAVFQEPRDAEDVVRG